MDFTNFIIDNAATIARLERNGGPACPQFAQEDSPETWHYRLKVWLTQVALLAQGVDKSQSAARREDRIEDAKALIAARGVALAALGPNGG